MAITLTDVLQRLHKVKGPDGGGQYKALCPCHDDHNPSLSIAEKDGKVLIKCFACGAGYSDVLDTLGFQRENVTPEQAFRPQQGDTFKETVYSYYDADGRLIAQKIRTAKYPKGSWRRPDGSGGWIWNRKGVPFRLYVAGSLSSNAIFVAEGEKDCETLRMLGYDAVSAMDGAGKGKWKKEYTGQLEGKSVCIFQDNDDIGRAFGMETARALYGHVSSLQLFDLRTVWPEIPEKGDISDLVQQLGMDEALEVITTLIGSTPQWEPFQEQESKPDKPLLTCVDDVPYEPPRWTIAPYIQRGKGTLIQGDNGTGKTVLACGFVALVSSGRSIPGLNVQAPGDVIILSVEDDLPVLRGRIEASGGNLKRCHFMTEASRMTLTSPELEQAIKQVNAAMIVFDPLQAFLGANVDMHMANQTRPVLANLFEMCDRNDCACLILGHNGKNTLGKSAVNLALGSVDIPASMRSIIHLIVNPEDPTERLALHIKCSNAPKGKTIAYGITDRGGADWHGFSDFTEADLRDTEQRKAKGVPYDSEPLVQVFNQLATDRPGGGFWSYADLKEEGAKILGFPPFGDPSELKRILDESLARELQKRDGLIVTHSVKAHGNARGIRITQYKVPQGYQTKIQEG